MMEKGEKESITNEYKENLGKGKKLFYWSLSFGVIFALVFGGFYYCFEYNIRLTNAQHALEVRVVSLESEQRDTYGLILQMATTLQSITDKFKDTKQSLHTKDSVIQPSTKGRNIKKNELNTPPLLVVQKSRLKRNIDSSVRQRNGQSSQIEVLERTIHSFRREMFSLNDRLRVLLRYNDQQKNAGPAGDPGPPGKVGPAGIPGINGRDGYHGQRGENGVQGPEGGIGPAGNTGKDGLNGINGIPGLPGFKGQKGIKGLKGGSGRHGRDGITGRTGTIGPKGRPGPSGKKGEPGICSSPCYYPSSRYLHMIPEEEEESKEKKSQQITYTKWGSSNCPMSSRIVYSGHIGMSKYEHETGIFTGSNVVCMPIQPKQHRKRYKRQATSVKDTGNGDDVDPQSYSYFLRRKDIPVPTPTTANTDSKNETPPVNNNNNSSERLSDPSISSNFTEPSPMPDASSQTTPTTKTTTTTTSPTKTTATTTRETRAPTQKPTNRTPKYVPKYADMVGTRKYIPCAVCDVQHQSQQIMIPASSSCPTDWQLQYHGYLMNYHHGTQAANIICVNDQALGISPSSDAGIRKIVSKYLSHIVTDCTTFPCPPLNHSELLKCVVCSK